MTAKLVPNRVRRSYISDAMGPADLIEDNVNNFATVCDDRSVGSSVARPVVGRRKYCE